jgi:hypothetical protein
MIDSLASRIVTRLDDGAMRPKLHNEADKLADYYAALSGRRGVWSPRGERAQQGPGLFDYQYNPLIKENRLARLLFERSAASYLADPRSLADLVEGSEIHVMALAYRALGLDDPRRANKPQTICRVLLGTLLRPMLGLLASSRVQCTCQRSEHC